MAGDFSLIQFYSLAVILSLICSTLSSSTEGKVKELTDANWDEVLEGEWMIKFYAPWCPACQHVAPIWSAFAVKSQQLGINVAEVDVTQQSALSGRFMVSSLPTIYHVKDGRFCKFEGSRSLDGFESFIIDEKWHQVDPIPWWKSPGSYLMSALGILFKMSMLLMKAHDALTITYGLPSYVSYAIFGVCTVGLGLCLGLVLVCVSEYLFGGQADHQEKKRKPTVEKAAEGEESKKEEDNKEDSGPVRKRKIQASTD